jgi:hypothetical protein
MRLDPVKEIEDFAMQPDLKRDISKSKVQKANKYSLSAWVHDRCLGHPRSVILARESPPLV